MPCACDDLYSFLCIVFHPFFFQSLYFSLLSLLIRFCLYINIRFYCIPWIHLFIIMPCGRYQSRSTEKFYVPFPRFSIGSSYAWMFMYHTHPQSLPNICIQFMEFLDTSLNKTVAFLPCLFIEFYGFLYCLIIVYFSYYDFVDSLYPFLFL